MKNQVQLITYPNSLGGDLKALRSLLERHFQDIFKGVHILPPYPSSGDRGFAPVTYAEIDPAFGDWEDVRRIGENFDVLLDLMVNHISRRSPYFQDFEQKGRRSEYADLFLTLEKVWQDGNPLQEDIEKIFLRRPEHPFVDIKVKETGERERLWATFGAREWSEQIDLDVNSPRTKKYFTEILENMSHSGVKILRLDAIAYVIKEAGTNCFFVEPEIYEFINWIQREGERVGIELLPEVHAHYSIQRKLARHGTWVYNFILPLLVLHALLTGSSRVLKEHLQDCPHRQFTMLDCHDGIPVQPDLDGVLDIDSAQHIVQLCLARGANLSRIYSDKHKLRADFDAHQINCTYYSALGGSDDAYLAARAIQFFAPGIPQVYYVGLLAGENEPGEIERTGEKRAINRRNFTTAEVEAALQKPVVQRLLELIRFRNQHVAFDGEFEVMDASDRELHLGWKKGLQRCALYVDLASARTSIEYTSPSGELVKFSP